jgi:LytS/YehU family sensor histidine kinase
LVGISDTKIQSERGTSAGLKNVNRRIQMNFGSEYGMSVYSTEQVEPDVQLSMPLIK